MGEREKALIKTVIDTNVFVSSLLFVGPANQLVDYWKKGVFIYLISKPILEEYIQVLSYPKFQLTEEEIKVIIEDELLPYIEVVESKTSVSVIKDDIFDNLFLSAALDGKASYIVSGDEHLLELNQYNNIRILKIRDFLDLIDKY